MSCIDCELLAEFRSRRCAQHRDAARRAANRRYYETLTKDQRREYRMRNQARRGIRPHWFKAPTIDDVAVERRKSRIDLSRVPAGTAWADGEPR